MTAVVDWKSYLDNMQVWFDIPRLQSMPMGDEGDNTLLTPPVPRHTNDIEEDRRLMVNNVTETILDDVKYLLEWKLHLQSTLTCVQDMLQQGEHVLRLVQQYHGKDDAVTTTSTVAREEVTVHDNDTKMSCDHAEAGEAGELSPDAGNRTVKSGKRSELTQTLYQTLPLQLPLDLTCPYNNETCVFRLQWSDDVRASTSKSNTRGKHCCFVEIVSISTPALQNMVGVWFSSFSKAVNVFCAAVRAKRVSAFATQKLYATVLHDGKDTPVNISTIKQIMSSAGRGNDPIFRNPLGSPMELVALRNELLRRSKLAYPECLAHCKEFAEPKIACGQDLTVEQYVAMQKEGNV